MPTRPPFDALRRRIAALALVVLPAASLHTAHAAEAAAYRFSPVNQYGIALTAGYWNPIIAYVSEKSGVKLELKIGRTSADTTSFVLAQEVDFVFSNHLFSPEREKMGWKVFGRRAGAAVQGQLVVPADSPVTDLAQLKGKEVVFPGPEALVSYKYPYAHLLSKGIPVTAVFGGNTDGALAQLFSGKVAAAGVNSQLVEGYGRREGVKYRVLWSTPPLHDLALMHSARVPAKDAEAVAKAFFMMANDPRGKDLLEQASKSVGMPSMAPFIASDGSEYSAYRDFYRTAPLALH